ncbi:unnamed protein product, partial [marine sediment metagenome]
APLIKDRKGEHLAVFEDLRKAGYVRVRVNGKIHDLSEEFDLDKNRRHTIEAVVDRLVLGDEEQSGRISDSVETALKLGAGVVLVSIVDGEELLFSEHFACIHCGISLGEIAPRTFSFNSPHGACPACTGLGVKLEIDPELVIPNKQLTIAEGAIRPWSRTSSISSWYASMLESVARRYSFSVHVPVESLTQEQLSIILYGSGNRLVTLKHKTQLGRIYQYDTFFEGVIPNLERRYRDTESDYIRAEIDRYMRSKPCPACKGQRLKPESLAVTVGDVNISQVTSMSIEQALEWIKKLDGSADDGHQPVLSSREQLIARQILKEIGSRLGFLMNVGLDYLTLDRVAGSLSGGEAERIRLATQIGCGLMGVLYICDEPTIGLHPADGSRLIETLKKLRDL